MLRQLPTLLFAIALTGGLLSIGEAGPEWLRFTVAVVAPSIIVLWEYLIYGRHREANPAAHGGAANGTRAGWIARTARRSPPGADADPRADPLPRTGPEVGEIVAYRVWFHVSKHPFLISATKRGSEDVIWSPSEPMTGEPGDTGNVGVHGWKTMNDALRYTSGRGVFGRVKLWGEVVEHERGYRAEYGRVHAIDYVNVWHVTTKDDPFVKNHESHQLDLKTLARLRVLYRVGGDDLVPSAESREDQVRGVGR